MLLIFPPLAKPCEPPAGIARLAGAVRAAGRRCTIVDGNLEGLNFLFNRSLRPGDTWGRRAVRGLSRNLARLRTSRLYGNFDRYQRAVLDVNRVLELSGEQVGISLSLADYRDPTLSPLRRDDLLRAARNHRDNIFFPWFKKRLGSLIRETSPALIGFSLNYLSQALSCFAMIGFVKANYPEIPVVLGGGLITSWMSDPQRKNPFRGLVDHLVSGPGETRLLVLLGENSAQPHPLPDYTDLPRDNYLAPGFILPYGASSGCYWNRCSFCPETAEGNPYTRIPTDLVVEQLRTLCRQYKPALIHFLDNAISPKLMKGLIKQSPGAPWYGFARATPQLADPGFCRALRRSGCIMLKLGLESGDQGVLNAMDKGIDLELVDQVLHSLEQAEIATYVYLLFGTPREGLPQARETLQFTAAHHSAIGFLNLAIFNMPVAAPDVSLLRTRDFSPADLSLYRDFRHPLGWDRKQVRSFLDREFRRHPRIAPIIRRDPPLFTSNHAPFFSPFGFSFSRQSSS